MECLADAARTHASTLQDSKQPVALALGTRQIHASSRQHDLRSHKPSRGFEHIGPKAQKERPPLDKVDELVEHIALEEDKEEEVVEPLDSIEVETVEDNIEAELEEDNDRSNLEDLVAQTSKMSVLKVECQKCTTLESHCD